MKPKDVFNKIDGILKELIEQYQYLQTDDGDLNELEIELFAANAQFLKDHAEILKKIIIQRGPVKVGNSKTPTVPTNETKRADKQETHEVKPALFLRDEDAFKEKFFEPVVQQLKQADTGPESKHSLPKTKTIVPPFNINYGETEIHNGTDDADVKDAPVIYSFIREAEPALIPDTDVAEDLKLAAQDGNDVNDYANKVNTEPTSEVAPTNTADNIIKAEEHIDNAADSKGEDILVTVSKEKEPTEPITINQKMSSQRERNADLTAKPTTVKPIGDLKLAITMNDKMLYVKELFNGYNLAYSEAIEILNRFTSFEEASRFLKTNYVTKNKWESKPATTEKFYALLKRRYPPVL